MEGGRERATERKRDRTLAGKSDRGIVRMAKPGSLRPSLSPSLLFSFAFVAFLSIVQSAMGAAAPTVWEMKPYRIQVYLAFEAEPELTPQLRNRIEARLVERAERAVGAAWDLSVEPVPSELEAKLLAPLGRLAIEELPSSLLESEADKLILASVRVTDGGFQVEARDYDLHARTTGSPIVRQVAQRELLPDEVFQAVLTAFAPLARIEKVDDKVVTLRLRAASLPPTDPSIMPAAPGDVFRAVRRFNDREGKLKKLMPIDWTFLVVEQVNAADVTCQLHTGLRSPLTGRSRGRDERLAILVRPTGGSTELELHSRMLGGDPKTVRAMAGYAIYAHPAGSPETVLVGRTDGDGRLAIPAAANPLRILLVKHGGEPLARLPIMPGLEPRTLAEIPDDDQRLLAEGIITGIQERLVDFIARRQVALTQARARLEDNKPAEAKTMLDELRSLPRQEDWINEIRIQKQRAVADDKRMQKKIDKLFDDTEQAVIRFLSPADIEKLESEVKAKLGGR